MTRGRTRKKKKKGEGKPKRKMKPKRKIKPRFKKCPFRLPSNDLIWAITKKDSCFIRKRGGCIWDLHPYNITGKNSKIFSGLANRNPVRVEYDAETLKATLWIKKGKPKYPKKANGFIPLGPHKVGRTPARRHVKDKDGKRTKDENGKFVYHMINARDKNYNLILGEDGKPKKVLPPKSINFGCRAARNIWLNLHGHHKKITRRDGKRVFSRHRVGMAYNKRLAKFAIAKYHKLYRAEKVDLKWIKETRAKIAKSKAVVDAADEE